MTVAVSAPGKVFLMGEHAVVYGTPALLSAVNKRLVVTARSSSSFSISTQNKHLKEYMRYAAGIVTNDQNMRSLPQVTLSVDSDIPYGYHLGSSAAVAAATVGALLYVVSKLWNPDKINKLAYEVEKKQHGNPSGADNTSVVFGGFLWYRKELQYLKSMWQLPLVLDKENDHFFLVNTGKPVETTGEMVEYVAERKRRYPSRIQKALIVNEQQTRLLADALKHKRSKDIISAIQAGQHTLEVFGVVSSEVKKFIRDVEKLGGAAKILGGGGRKKSAGYVLCYHKKMKEVSQAAGSYGYEVESVVLGGDGIRLEKKMHES